MLNSKTTLSRGLLLIGHTHVYLAALSRTHPYDQTQMCETYFGKPRANVYSISFIGGSGADGLEVEKPSFLLRCNPGPGLP